MCGLGWLQECLFIQLDGTSPPNLATCTRLNGTDKSVLCHGSTDVSVFLYIVHYHSPSRPIAVVLRFSAWALITESIRCVKIYLTPPPVRSFLSQVAQVSVARNSKIGRNMTHAQLQRRWTARENPLRKNSRK